MVVFVFFCSTANAMTYKEVGQNETNFYKNPSNELFQNIQLGIDENIEQIKSNKNNVFLLDIVFISCVHKKYNWPIASTAMSKYVKQALDSSTKLGAYLQDDSIVDLMKLDVWWVSYFATGESVYLDKLSTYVGIKQKENETNMVYHAANWSYRANCRQHKSVAEHARSLLSLDTLSPEKREYLESCLKSNNSANKAMQRTP